MIRDRLGIKPLYFGSVDDRFFFASELKALRTVNGWKPEVDRDAVAGFLRFNHIPAPLDLSKCLQATTWEPALLRPGEDPAVARYWTMADVIRQERSRGH